MAAGSVKDPEVEKARAALDHAERQLASGTGGVDVNTLHRLRDKWRHAHLSAEGAAVRAEQEQAKARMDALTGLGAQIDQLAADDPRGVIAAALAQVVEACARVRALGRDHDAGLVELTAAAQDLGVEAAAPGGPRATSGHVAVEGQAVIHRRTKLVPVGRQVERALSLALTGDLEAAVAEVHPVTAIPEPRRPDHLLRGSGGMLVPVHGEISAMMLNQLRTGDLVDLGQHGINQYMAGDLR
jgi:hypothetical protein